MDKKNLSLLLMGIYLVGSYPVYSMVKSKSEIVHATTLDEYKQKKELKLKIPENSSKEEVLFNQDYDLNDRLKFYLGNNCNNVGLIYYDFTTGDSVVINGDKKFVAASTYKVGLNIVAYTLAEKGALDLSEELHFKEKHYEGGTGVIQVTANFQKMQIQELLDLSLINSDNIATNMLGDKLGGHANVRKELYNLIGYDFKGDYSQNILTPNLELEILKYLYSNKENPYYEHMLKVMANTEFKDRTEKYLPYGIAAHKIGTFDNYIHDVGIVLDDNPYAFIMYTDSIDNASEEISLIAKAIYESHITKR